MGDYNLSCSQTQGAKHASHVADTHSHSQGHSSHVGSQGPSRSASPALPSASSHIHSKPVLINSVLSFIKAYRLKRDVESLKKRVCQHFSPAGVENAKKELWDYCRKDLKAASIAYHIRRGSDKRSQLAANVDDLAEAFVALDSSDLIPGIYCEATDLLRIPSLSLDPVSEKVETNTLSLNDLVAKVDCLEAKIASLVGVCSKASSYSSYAATTSSNATVPLSSSPVARNLSVKSPPSGDRECNLILFGLPEGRSIVDTKDSVDEIMEFLAGKPIPVKDVFRLGRYDRTSSGSQSSRRPQPVLVKLTTQWDRKLILLCKSNLRSFKISRLFLREDVYILKWPLSPLLMRLILSPVFLLLPLMVTNLKQVLQLLTTPIRGLKSLEIILLPVPLLLLYIISFLNFLNLPHLLICPPQPLLLLLLFKGIHLPHNGFSSLYVF